MARLLLNLRHVPDDEADAVRALLAQHRIATYETRPGPLGISAGGIWAGDPLQEDRAVALVADYQAERARLAREARDQAIREGRHSGTWQGLRERPWQGLAAIFGILAALAFATLPFLLWR